MDMEPYLEKKIIIPGEIVYPFSCFITDDQTIKYFVPPHFHKYIEIIYVTLGEMRVQIGNQNYIAKAGSLVLIDSREVHSTLIDKSTSKRCIILKFESEVFSNLGASLEMRYIVPFLNPDFPHQKIFKKEEVDEAFIPELMEEVLNEFQKKEYGFELSVIAGIYKIFLWILRNKYSLELRKQLERLNKTVNIEKFQKALKYVEEHFQEEISTSSLAEMCNMSYSYFSRQFSKIMGKTFKEYLNFVRINEAEKLLLATDLNITEVAMNTGFSNSSYFIKQFKLYKYFSPKQYKKHFLK